MGAATIAAGTIERASSRHSDPAPSAAAEAGTLRAGVLADAVADAGASRVGELASVLDFVVDLIKGYMWTLDGSGSGALP